MSPDSLNPSRYSVAQGSMLSLDSRPSFLVECGSCWLVERNRLFWAEEWSTEGQKCNYKFRKREKRQLKQIFQPSIVHMYLNTFPKTQTPSVMETKPRLTQEGQSSVQQAFCYCADRKFVEITKLRIHL